MRALGDLEGPPLATCPLEALNLTAFTLQNRKWKYIYLSLFVWGGGDVFCPYYFLFRLATKNAIIEKLKYAAQQEQ